MRPVGKGLGWALRLLAKIIIFPIYSFIVLLKIRTSRALASARGLFFLVFTNRYVFHIALVAIALVTVGTQLQTKRAVASDVGRRSVLYALVTDGRDDIVEESGAPEPQAKPMSYFGQGTIQALPGIDFDYETGDEGEPLIADANIPGSIAVVPGATDPGIPGTVVVLNRTKTETYSVKAGDTVGSIATRFGVNAGTIIWANKLTSRAAIKPGDALKIPPVSGVLHTVKKGDTVQKIASLYKANTEEINSMNQLTPNRTLVVGEEIVVPGGTPPPVVVAVKPSVPVRPGVPKTSISGKQYDQYGELQGKPDDRAKPEDSTATAPAGKLLWPTRLHVINQYYGWRHTGLDVDGDYTDPLYASEDGVVESAGWNSSGYGLQILINHGNGIKTRYAHASKVFVTAGEQVKRGQVIAMMGTTGRSTGTHLHYEVYINGKRVNPLAYIK